MLACVPNVHLASLGLFKTKILVMQREKVREKSFQNVSNFDTFKKTDQTYKRASKIL